MANAPRGRQLRYVIDANLTSKIMLCLRVLGIPTSRHQKDQPDGQVLAEINAQPNVHAVWVTGDHQARTEHSQAILDSGASIAWLRANHARQLKQVVIALWFVLAARDELAESDEPLYFEVVTSAEGGHEKFELRHTLV